MRCHHLKFLIIFVFIALFLSCENRQPQRPPFGTTTTDEHNDADRDTDVTVPCHEGNTKRSSVRCGDSFGGYFEELCHNGVWVSTEKCLSPTISVEMVEDLTRATPSITPISAKKIDGKFYIGTLEYVVKTNGTSAGTEIVIDRKCVAMLGNLNLVKINHSLYHLCIDASLLSYQLLRQDETTGAVTNLQDEIHSLDLISFDFENFPKLYQVGQALLLYSPKDKALFSIDIDKKSVVLLKKNITNIYNSFQLKDNFYFTAKTEDGNYIFFMTDGTVIGTKETIPAIKSADVDRISVAVKNDDAYLIISDGYKENSLWSFDGNNGTQKCILEKNEHVGKGITTSHLLDNKLYYTAWYDTGLFVTDGTADGTKQIFTTSILQNTLFSIHNRLFFATKEAVTSYDHTTNTFEEISDSWKEILYANAIADKMLIVALKDDGRVVVWHQQYGDALIEQQTLLPAENNFKEFDHIEYRVFRQDKSDSRFLFKLTKRYMGRGLPGEIIVNAEEHYLFISDGTAKGTLKIKEDRNEDWNILAMIFPSVFIGNSVVYSHFDKETGTELWSYHLSNHTSELLKDISNEGTVSSQIENIFAVGNSIYFSQQRKVNGADTDRGDIYYFEEGETLKKTSFNNVPIERLTFIENFVPGESGGYFFYDTNIYIVDGTTSGDLVFDWPTTDYFYSPDLSVFDDRLYASVILYDQGKPLSYLYKENERGKLEEITLLNDIIRDETQDISQITVVGKLGDTLLLNVDRQLWSFNGKTIERDLTQGVQVNFRATYEQLTVPLYPPFFRKMKEEYLFVTESGKITTLWSSNGTKLGTKPLRDFENAGTLGFLDQKEKTIYFTTIEDSQLWKTDGTISGTKKIVTKDEWNKAYPFHTRIKEGVFGENFFYFSLNKGEHCSSYDENCESGEVWKSDGTELGTLKIADFPFVPADSSFDYIDRSIEKLHFHNGLLFFFVVENNTRELYVSDGTPEHTMKLNTLAANLPHDIENLTAAESYIVFTGDDDIHGSELWKLTVSYK